MDSDIDMGVFLTEFEEELKGYMSGKFGRLDLPRSMNLRNGWKSKIEKSSSELNSPGFEEFSAGNRNKAAVNLGRGKSSIDHDLHFNWTSRRDENFHNANRKRDEVSGDNLCVNLDMPVNLKSGIKTSKDASGLTRSDGTERGSFREEDILIVNETGVIKEVSSRKRKRRSTWTMLNWVFKTAKDPCDPMIGELPSASKWKHYGNEECWKQVLLAREALFLNHPVDKKQRMHPSMYEDHTGPSNHHRHSQRLICVKNLPAEPGLQYLSVGQGDLKKRSNSFNAVKKDTRGDHSINHLSLFANNRNRIRIPVGPFFQAKVPEWNGEASESDPKWLGTRTWPLAKGERRCLVETERVGKGRQDSCGCQFSGSVECVRFHIAEKKLRLELELCSAFLNWKFDKMGEEVALSWTKKDESRFKAIVSSNLASEDKSFWDQIYKSFPSKNTEDLVNYYYNVFLLRRRSLQNRITPNSIDSDDESEFTPTVN